jgi:Putative zinc-finger
MGEGRMTRQFLTEAADSMSSIKKPTAREEAIARDHQEAMTSHAVELYLLNELLEDERTQFEEHYFECETCADAVEAGQIFVGNIRPVAPAPALWWRQPMAAAAALFLVLAGGQQLFIASLLAPQANTTILAREQVKGGEEKAYPLRTPSTTIEVSLPPDTEFSFYRVKIAGGLNRSLSQIVPAPAKDSEHRLSVQVLRRTLGNGHFTVLVEGLDREDSKDGHLIDEVYEFQLK